MLPHDKRKRKKEGVFEGDNHKSYLNTREDLREEIWKIKANKKWSESL